MSKKLTKWQISAQEGSCKPHELEERIGIYMRRHMEGGRKREEEGEEGQEGRWKGKEGE